MKTIINTIFLLSILAFSAEIHAQQTILYKISGKKLKAPSYLFGTIHATCDSVIDDKTVDAISKTKQVCLELDFDDPNMQAEFIVAGKMKNEVKLSDLISKEDALILDSYFLENLGAPLQALENLKPAFISSLFLQKLLDCKVFSKEAGITEIATKNKMEVIGLETISLQMNVFDKIPYDYQAKELVKSIKEDFKGDKVDFEKLTKLYLEGDLEEMLHLSDKSSAILTKDYFEILITERNNVWLPQIEKIMRKKATFFGVGALHLAGEGGLITMLRKAGYTVELVH